MVEPIEIFEKLECNDTEIVESARAEIYALFQNRKESWVVNGLYEYYLSNNSLRSMEILANVNESHHRYLFDRLTDSIKRQETELKVKALTLLGHIVRKQPTWIYKIHDHPLMKEILTVLKNEDNILALISALLLIIVLMPMIPSLMASHLQEVFDIFSRLASWNMGTWPLNDKQMMIHMQISLYALFLRLYGMYPCNFIAYLRLCYRDKNSPVFIHTIQPMLETVRMHPRLVTTTKDYETSFERWKTVGVHQAIAECEQFYVDVVDKCPHDCCYVNTGFRSRSGTTNSTINDKSKFELYQLRDFGILSPQEDRTFFSPSFTFPDRSKSTSGPTEIVHQHFIETGSHEGTSPPEAAIEATPETTPVRDTRFHSLARAPHVSSSVVRGLTTFTKNRSANTTPTHSQPSSPMRKDATSPFHFPTSSSGSIKRDSLTNQRLQKMLLERSQSMEAYIQPISGITPLNAPSSPVKILVSADHARRNESPFSKEDEEVESIVAPREDCALPSSPRKCDSVLHEIVNDDNDIDNTLEQGSPCSQGGLHMPNSRSMNDFAKRVQRLRYHSHNYDREQVEISTGSSPGKDSASTTQQFLEIATVRRANSCPDMKKKSPVSKKGGTLALNQTEELCEEEVAPADQKDTVTRETQTEDSYMPYEHLFLNIFPCLSSSEVKSSPSPSPIPLKPFGDRESQHSVHNVLDKYVEISKGEVSHPSIQIQLLQQQLLFERYRRETFAARNRKLLADAKNVKALEEYNSALKDMLELQQRDLEKIKGKLSIANRQHSEEESKHLRYRKQLEDKIVDLQNQVFKLEVERDTLKHDQVELREKYNTTDNRRQQASGALFDAQADLHIAKEQAAMGDKARAEVERLNKEILLLGELQIRYQEKLEDSIKTRMVNAELEILEASYKEEVRCWKNKIDSSRCLLDTYRQRLSDLENLLSEKDEGIAQLKKNLSEVSSENNEKIKAVESKYKSQLAINRALEQKMLQLFTKIEFPGIRSLHSPETSSCQEAIATASVSGPSPHSSPLSVSLASSESSNAFLSSDIKDMKNLQVLVDRKSNRMEDSIESAGDTIETLHQPSTSNTQQHD